MHKAILFKNTGNDLPTYPQQQPKHNLTKCNCLVYCPS